MYINKVYVSFYEIVYALHIDTLNVQSLNIQQK